MINYLAGLGFTALFILIAHWFPWPIRLHRLMSYGIGITCILIGQAIWLLPLPAADLQVVTHASGLTVWLYIASFAVVAGISTAFAWFADWVLNLSAKDRINARRPDQFD